MANYVAMDTNGDGVVDNLDDPYEPYYPGDTSVDWVGMSVRYIAVAKLCILIYPRKLTPNNFVCSCEL